MDAWGAMIFCGNRASCNLMLSLPWTEGIQLGREKLIAPQLPSPQRGRASKRFLARWPLKSNSKGSQGDNSNWRPPCHLSLAIRLAAPLPDHVQALQSIALPPWWVSEIPAVDTRLMVRSWHQLQKIVGRDHWSVWIRWDGVAGKETQELGI